MKRSFWIMLLAYMTMLLALLMTACSYSPSNSVFCDGSSPYLNILPKALPQYDIRAVESGYEAERLGSSIAVEVFDYQAETLMQSSRKLYWYPQYAVTVVIAVDRDKTCADIRGWKSLLNCDGSIMLSYNEPFNCCFAAVSYGLCGEDFDMDGALKLFEELEQTGRMTQNADADIQICFDYQAAAQMKAGRKLEIIIPEEGTLSFTKGLLSNKELKLPVHMDILLEQSGLRTDEGEADRRLYPMESEYARAKKLDDYTKMLGATESAWARYRREAQHTDLFATADGREHIIAATAAIAVVVAWAGTMIGRLLNRQMRVIVFIAAAEMVLWLLVRTIKWQLPIAGALNRYLWYSFYLFQLGLPVTMLRLTVSIGVEGHAAAPRWWKVCLMVNILAFLLVLTNDMHMLVFRMDLSQPGWSGNYSYGIGYFAVCMVNAACIFLTLMLLIKKCGKTPRRNALLFPVGLRAYYRARAGVGHKLHKAPSGTGDNSPCVGKQGAFGGLNGYSGFLCRGLAEANGGYLRLAVYAARHYAHVHAVAFAGDEPGAGRSLSGRRMRKLYGGGHVAYCIYAVYARLIVFVHRYAPPVHIGSYALAEQAFGIWPSSYGAQNKLAFCLYSGVLLLEADAQRIALFFNPFHHGACEQLHVPLLKLLRKALAKLPVHVGKQPVKPLNYRDPAAEIAEKRGELNAYNAAAYYHNRFWQLVELFKQLVARNNALKLKARDRRPCRDGACGYYDAVCGICTRVFAFNAYCACGGYRRLSAYKLHLCRLKQRFYAAAQLLNGLPLKFVHFRKVYACSFYMHTHARRVLNLAVCV